MSFTFFFFSRLYELYCYLFSLSFKCTKILRSYCYFRCLQFLSRRFLLKRSHTSTYNYSTGNESSYSCDIIRCQKDSLYGDSTVFSLLLRRECCTFSNGEYVKAGLAELELWCCQAKEEVIPLL